LTATVHWSVVNRPTPTIRKIAQSLPLISCAAPKRPLAQDHTALPLVGRGAALGVIECGKSNFGSRQQAATPLPNLKRTIMRGNVCEMEYSVAPQMLGE
jgi:hypothetical protein